MLDLSSEYPLTKSQIEGYHQDGHIHLSSVCTTEEVTSYRHAIAEAAYSRFPKRDTDDVSNILGIDSLPKLYTINPEELNFHTSWDWLMPVVEKVLISMR